jgi:hypothetical protein
MAAKKKAVVNGHLNQWCIEMALRWPTVRIPPSYGQVAGAAIGGVYGQFQHEREVDADVIGRAAKILAWVKTAS